ncbi:hypothetical protein PG997_006323 [Apiospora hydei]|uniref:Uncharacterized protein n=1 Tax=Apiospora hydei TaxID=1337664 RepID=A0ABR1WNF9_9PEZI
MSDSNSGTTATDIITYIGVPLAVLGVLPILYNTIATLAALSKIKRMLRHSRLTALTRSDVVNRVIEVELPRYAVTPWDRFSQRSEYWQLSRQPSQIPGGSWTTFNWKTNTIGIKTQRVEYADQLRQPQVEVAFDELVSYLLDLGAVPDPHGWKLLRSTGLWTPAGCALMTARGGQKALSIAPLDDSDGHLSLAVNWLPSWTTRDFSSLPPYWVSLPPPPKKAEAPESAEASTAQDALETTEDKEPVKKDTGSVYSQESMVSFQRQGEDHAAKPITCQISVEGLTTAISQEADLLRSDSSLHSLFIGHLRVRRDKQDGMWFASACTAYGTTSQTMLWNYKIPDEILAFARRDTVPCGVLVLLGVVDDAETPEWSTKHNTIEEQHEQFVRRNTEQQLALRAEMKMAPADRQRAAAERMQRENMQRMQDSKCTWARNPGLSIASWRELTTLPKYEVRDKMRLDRQRQEARESEALQSPKWDTKLIADHNLRWLKSRHEVDDSLSLKDAAGTLLHRMVLDGQFTSSICGMLDLWKAWADNGGMRKSDYTALRDDQETFAQASLLVAMIKDATTAALEGSLSVELQECMRMWRTVRLG